MSGYAGMSRHRSRLAQRLASEGTVPIDRHGKPVALLVLNGYGYALQRAGTVVCTMIARTAEGAVAEAERTVGDNPELFQPRERS